MVKKLAIITSHPIQYNAPLFRLISKRGNIKVKVFYTWGQAKDKIFDPDFGHIRSWDIPLLEGYDHEFIENISSQPGSHHFRGIINPDIYDKINIWNPSCILVYGWAFSGHLKAIRKFKGKIPVFFRGDSTRIDESNRFSLKKYFKRIFLKWVYSHIDIAFYVGCNNKKYFNVHGLLEGKLIFAPHAVENERFFGNDILASKAIQWKKDIGINGNSIVFLYAGKFHEKKNPILLIEAFRELPNFSKEIHLILAGEGKLETEMTKRAEGARNIHFLTFQNQSKMPLLYHLCNVFILPSKGPGETWGLGINEAMAAKKAVIVSDKVGCMPDLVKQGKNGYIFESGNKADLLYKMIKCIEGDVDKMGEESYKIIEDYNLESVAQIIETQVLKI